MDLIRIAKAEPLNGFKVELTLTTGEAIQRDVGRFLSGPVFDPIRSGVDQFRQLRAEDGTVVWPNGAELCPDVLIWACSLLRMPSPARLEGSCQNQVYTVLGPMSSLSGACRY
jgi:hypothetical protein